MIEQALARWATIARAPQDRPPSLFSDRCKVRECCPEPADERDLLELAIRALPRKSARELRGIVLPSTGKSSDAVPYGNPPHRWWQSAF
ncbi:hypothetical protein [Streptomyces griseus]|uniref:hypothetical protein n=1 Tax=Streptomyces griseus TaxID=1911 RepID=UPI0036A45EEF